VRETRLDAYEPGQDDKEVGEIDRNCHMIRPARKIVTLVLIATTALTGVVPAIGVCGTITCERGSKQRCGGCCGKSSESANACCSKPAQPLVCHCSVDEERPAAPQERRSSDERDAARRVVCLLAVVLVADERPSTQPIVDVTFFSSLPSLRRQAVLCRWLI
jgi:hypothetical protein